MAFSQSRIRAACRLVEKDGLHFSPLGPMEAGGRMSIIELAMYLTLFGVSASLKSYKNQSQSVFFRAYHWSSFLSIDTASISQMITRDCSKTLLDLSLRHVVLCPCLRLDEL